MVALNFLSYSFPTACYPPPTTLQKSTLLAPSTRRWSEHGRSLNPRSFSSLRHHRRCPSKPAMVWVMGAAAGMGEMVVGRKKLAVFVSGRGSNLRTINEASEDGTINGEVVVVVTDKHDCGGAQYAIERGIRVVLFPKSSKVPDGLSPLDLVSLLRECGIDFILLAGYMKLIPVELVRAYPKSILNIHPSLLPAFGGKGFYGLKVHNAVIASGARYSGPTIHFVDECYDTGKILAQKAVPVLADDSAEKLAARVLNEEHKLYVEAVAALCEDRIVWRDDGVPLIQSRKNPMNYV